MLLAVRSANNPETVVVVSDVHIICTVSVTGAPGGAAWNYYTNDGVYQAFLPKGNYKFTISQAGYAPQTWSVSISPGQTGTGQNVYLEQSNIPVPEFGGVAVVAFSAVAGSVYLLRRRRR